jgi:hypothetical protein
LTAHRVPASARLTGEIYNHRLLWHTAQYLYEEGTSTEEGSHHFLLSSQLFVYLAFEGFMNSLGAIVAPNEWRDERKFFNQGEYRGTEGKLNFLAVALKVTLDKGARPYQTFTELERRRDYMVHSRPERVDHVVKAPSVEALPKSKEPELFAYSDPGFVRRAFDDVETLADMLQEAAQRELGDHLIWTPRAFVGMMWHQGGTLQ